MGNQTTGDKAELSACPCCGGETVAVGGDIPTAKQITIKCDGPQKSGLRGCGIQITGKRLRLSHAELLAALTERWNTRAPSPPASGDVVDKAMDAFFWPDWDQIRPDHEVAEYKARMGRALQAAGAAAVPEDVRGVLAETYYGVETVRATIDATARNAEEAGKTELGAMLYRYARNLVLATKHAEQVLAAAPER